MNQPLSQEPQPASSYPFVSVIIPVYNDAGRLKICLEALANQTYPQSQYEIIVIDNGSDAVEQVEAVVAQYPNAIATQELKPGSYAARNHGLTLTKGEVIAFTDADCVPAVDWLEKGVHHLLTTLNCGQVVGKVEIFFENPDRPTPVELYESVTAFPQERLLQQFRGGATANVLTWRKVIDQVGSFNDRLKSNGDLEWGKRVFLAGYQQVYAADVQVGHPARRSLNELHKRTVRLSGGVYDLYIQQDASFWERNKTFARLLLNDLVPPVNFIVNTFKNPKLNRLGYKVKVSLVFFFVRYISAWEKTRLKFGGVSDRG
ncbi:MAG: glycosyltransferase [Leptolyngbyaceae cyanobacterium SM1_4_3]|nr:glycosyltransferase [Leptolyngbyaceae cyanobacterium SM1_4_3]